MKREIEFFWIHDEKGGKNRRREKGGKDDNDVELT